MRNYLGMCLVVGLAAVFSALPGTGEAQDRLKSMPGYQQYEKMKGATAGSVKSGALDVAWKEKGKAFVYDLDGKRYRFDIAVGSPVSIGPATGENMAHGQGQEGQGRRRSVDR